MKQITRPTLALLLFAAVTILVYYQGVAPKADTLTSSFISEEVTTIYGTLETKNGPAADILVSINGIGTTTDKSGNYIIETADVGSLPITFESYSSGRRYKAINTSEQTVNVSRGTSEQASYVIEEVNPVPSPSPSPITTPTPTPSVIQTLSFYPTTITQGQTTRLTWAAHPVTFVEFNNGLGRKSAEGSLFLSPNQTTTYTLTVTYSIGTQTKTESRDVTITVNPINTTVSPPVKPRNLTVTNDGTNLLSLRWDSSYGATEYSVFRSPTNNLAGAEQVGTNVATSRATDTLSINDHSTYYYWVRAYKPNAIVGSEAEGPVSITLNATLRTPRFYRVQELSGKKIRLEWETYLEMNGTRANDSWEIWRKEDGASEFTKVYEGMSNTTSKWTDTLPKAKTRYYYKMRAYKTIRGERLYSDFSNETSAKS